MKKLILPVIVLLTAVLFLSPKVNAQTKEDCHKVFDKESYKCLTESTACVNSCVDKARSAMSLSVDGGKVNLECQRNTCDPAKKVCDEQVQTNFQACIDARKIKAASPKEAEAKKETPAKSQPRQYPADIFEKIPVTVGGWFEFASAGIEFGEFLTGFTKGFTITDDAIIEDEKEEKEWDQYYQSYNSLKSQGLTHEQIEATLQKPRKKDVSMSLQELDALKAKFPAGESITNVAGTTNTKLYSWDTDSGALIKSTDWEKIEFKQPVVKDNVTIRTITLEEGEIEVKVRNNKPAENQFGVDAGWLGVTVSRTHFWVSQGQDKKSAVIGVYEGEVEVKTKDGQTVKVKPDGDEPGVLVVSQKLSPVKLAAAGMVLAAIVGGIVWFVKKKSTLKLYKKR